MRRNFIDCVALVNCAKAQSKAIIAIDASKLEAKVSHDLHGIFFEEISHGGEGGLYGELIQNRGFEESRLLLATTFWIVLSCRGVFQKK